VRAPAQETIDGAKGGPGPEYGLVDLKASHRRKGKKGSSETPHRGVFIELPEWAEIWSSLECRDLV